MISVEINRSSMFDSIPQSTIRNPQWGNGFIHFFLEADGFLYNMARAIMGTLLNVGRGKITPDEFKQILDAKNRRLAGETVPAKGLCLMEIKY